MPVSVQFKYFAYRLLFTIFLVCYSASFGLAKAADGQNALTISPISQDITGRPGELVRGLIKLSNPSIDSVEVKASAVNFRAKDTSGQPAFFTDGESNYALNKWFIFDKTSYTINPQQSISIPFSLKIPVNAEPGGHYGAVLFTPTDTGLQSESSEVMVRPSIGSLLLVRVPGAIVEKSTLISFKVLNRTVSFHYPITFNFLIENSGNLHIRPYGEMVIKDWRGGTVDTVSINVSQAIVLPTSSRLFDVVWNPNSPRYGHFTASLAVFYGANQVLNRQVSFWVLPVWLPYLAGLTVLFLLLIMIFKPRLYFGSRR